MRFYDVNSGTIKVSDIPLQQLTRKSLRGNYGMVLQETWLRSGSIRDNIAMGKPDATDEEMYEAVARGEKPAESLEHLLELSKQRGAPDNVTAVLLYHE